MKVSTIFRIGCVLYISFCQRYSLFQLLSCVVSCTEICEDKPYNTMSDVWGLGCILYEMATLKRAFEGNNLPALVTKILRGRFSPIPSRYSMHLRRWPPQNSVACSCSIFLAYVFRCIRRDQTASCSVHFTKASVKPIFLPYKGECTYIAALFLLVSRSIEWTRRQLLSKVCTIPLLNTCPRRNHSCCLTNSRRECIRSDLESQVLDCERRFPCA